MKKTLSTLVTLLIAAIVMVAAGCQQDTLPNNNDISLNKLTREEYLDSLFKNDRGLEPIWMIDTTIVKGSMGWRVTDTMEYYPDLNNGFRYYWMPIGYFEPLSPDRDKFAVYTNVDRFIAFRAADSASQFGFTTGDTTLIVGMREFKRISRPFIWNSDEEANDYLIDFPHRKTNEKEVCDSFMRQYRPLEGVWPGLHLESTDYAGNLQGFYNNPEHPRNLFPDYNAIPQHNYIYLFKSGKVTVNDIDDDDIFWNELDRDDKNFMEVTTQTLADGREHHLMFVKIPYTYWKDDPKVSGFVRLRYVLD
jgi:hypothetical protein